MTVIQHPRSLLFLLLFIALSLAACAHGGEREETPEDRPREMGARTEETEEAEVEVAPPPPREIDHDRGVAIDTGAGTPQRRASLAVVEEGRGYLLSGRTREASTRFQRALQIDPTNGFAYYWLGRARIQSGDARGAVGVLQKAETLLGPYPEWRRQAADLLASIGAR